MSIKCKKCGCDALIKTDDWYKCPQCGATMFDTEVKVNDVTSPTKAMEEMESKAAQRLQSEAEKAPTENKNTAPMSSVNDNTLQEKPNKKYKKDKPKKKSKKDKKSDSDKISAQADASEAQEKPQKSKLRETVDFFIPIVVAVIIAILLKLFVFANAVVPTGSMLNTIQEGDRIIASRLAYINEDPQRYDIVIFRYPDNEEEYYVKRIIGLPGETVQVVNGVVYVTQTNGETIMLDDSFVTVEEPVGNFGPYEVPEDAYFMMGDNRNNSWDSRYWDNTFVYKDKIIGKVKFRYLPNISAIE